MFGIDLGTSYVRMEQYNNGEHSKVEITEDEGEEQDESLVRIIGKDVLIGDNIRCPIFSEENTFAFGPLCLIGRKYDDSVIAASAYWPFPVINNKGVPLIQCQKNGENVDVEPVTILSRIFRKLRRAAHKTRAKRPRFVIAIPGSYTIAHKRDILKAAEEANMVVEYLVSHTLAGAVMNIVQYPRIMQNSETCIIIDLGAGSLTISALSLKKGLVRVLSTVGDSYWGGSVITNAITSHCCDMERRSRIISEDVEKIIAESCEGAKKSLQGKTGVNLPEPYNECIVSFDVIQSTNKDGFENIRHLLKRCMKESDINPRKGPIILVGLYGGSARIRNILDIVHKEISRPYLYDDCSQNRDLIAGGAAYITGYLLDENMRLRSQRVIIEDLIPTLAVRCHNAFYKMMSSVHMPLLSERTESKSHTFSVATTEPCEVRVKLYERETTRQNRYFYIGTAQLFLHNLPKDTTYNIKVLLRIQRSQVNLCVDETRTSTNKIIDILHDDGLSRDYQAPEVQDIIPLSPPPDAPISEHTAEGRGDQVHAVGERSGSTTQKPPAVEDIISLSPPPDAPISEHTAEGRGDQVHAVGERSGSTTQKPPAVEDYSSSRQVPLEPGNTATCSGDRVQPIGESSRDPRSSGVVPLEPGNTSTNQVNQLHPIEESSHSTLYLPHFNPEDNYAQRISERNANTAFGLELGTTRILLGLLEGENPVRILTCPNWKNDPESVVQFNGELMKIGDDYTCNIFSPHNDDVCGILRLVGLRYNAYVEDVARFWPFSVVDIDGWPHMECTFKGKITHVSPETVLFEIMRQCKIFAERTVQQKDPFFVISVPGCCTYNQRRAVKRAANRAKLTDAFLINDTTALVLSKWYTVSNKSSVVVVDLGGGSFTVSAFSCTNTEIRVTSRVGDSRWGGDDLDKSIISYCYNKIKALENRELTRDEIKTLRTRCILAKRTLSVKESTIVHAVGHRLEITRLMFESWNYERFTEMSKLITRCLDEADIGVNAVSDVYRHGRSCSIPQIQNIIYERLLRKGRTKCDGVVIGAAVLAGLMTNMLPNHTMKVEELAPMVGVAINKKIIDTIVYRSYLPQKRQRAYVLKADNRCEVQLNIYEQDTKFVKKNICIGGILLPFLRSVGEDKAQTLVNFNVTDHSFIVAVYDKRNLQYKVVVLSEDVETDGKPNQQYDLRATTPLTPLNSKTRMDSSAQTIDADNEKDESNSILTNTSDILMMLESLRECECDLQPEAGIELKLNAPTSSGLNIPNTIGPVPDMPVYYSPLEDTRDPFQTEIIGNIQTATVTCSNITASMAALSDTQYRPQEQGYTMHSPHPNVPTSSGFVPDITGPYGAPQDVSVANLSEGIIEGGSNVSRPHEQGHILHPPHHNVPTSSGFVPDITGPYGTPQDVSVVNLSGGIVGAGSNVSRPTFPEVVHSVRVDRDPPQDNSDANVSRKTGKEKSNVDNPLELEQTTHPTLRKLLTKDFVGDRTVNLTQQKEATVSNITREMDRTDPNIYKPHEYGQITYPTRHNISTSSGDVTNLREQYGTTHDAGVGNLSKEVRGAGLNVARPQEPHITHHNQRNLSTSSGVDPDISVHYAPQQSAGIDRLLSGISGPNPNRGQHQESLQVTHTTSQNLPVSSVAAPDLSVHYAPQHSAGIERLFSGISGPNPNRGLHQESVQVTHTTSQNIPASSVAAPDLSVTPAPKYSAGIERLFSGISGPNPNRGLHQESVQVTHTTSQNLPVSSVAAPDVSVHHAPQHSAGIERLLTGISGPNPNRGLHQESVQVPHTISQNLHASSVAAPDLNVHHAPQHSAGIERLLSGISGPNPNRGLHQESVQVPHTISQNLHASSVAAPDLNVHHAPQHSAGIERLLGGISGPNPNRGLHQESVQVPHTISQNLHASSVAAPDLNVHHAPQHSAGIERLLSGISGPNPNRGLHQESIQVTQTTSQNLSASSVAAPDLSVTHAPKYSAGIERLFSGISGPNPNRGLNQESVQVTHTTSQNQPATSVAAPDLSVTHAPQHSAGIERLFSGISGPNPNRGLNQESVQVTHTTSQNQPASSVAAPDLSVTHAPQYSTGIDRLFSGISGPNPNLHQESVQVTHTTSQNLPVSSVAAPDLTVHHAPQHSAVIERLLSGISEPNPNRGLHQESVQVTHTTSQNLPASSVAAPDLGVTHAPKYSAGIERLFSGISGPNPNQGLHQESEQVIHTTSQNLPVSPVAAPDLSVRYAPQQSVGYGNVFSGISGLNPNVGTPQEYLHVTDSSRVARDLGVHHAPPQDANSGNLSRGVYGYGANIGGLLEYEQMTYHPRPEFSTSIPVVPVPQGYGVPSQNMLVANLYRRPDMQSVTYNTQQCIQRKGDDLRAYFVHEMNDSRSPDMEPVMYNIQHYNPRMGAVSDMRNTRGGNQLNVGRRPHECRQMSHLTRPTSSEVVPAMRGGWDVGVIPSQDLSMIKILQRQPLMQNPQQGQSTTDASYYRPEMETIPVTNSGGTLEPSIHQLDRRLQSTVQNAPGAQVEYGSTKETESIEQLQLIPESVTLDENTSSTSETISVLPHISLQSLLEQVQSGSTITLRLPPHTSDPNTDGGEDNSGDN